MVYISPDMNGGKRFMTSHTYNTPKPYMIHGMKGPTHSTNKKSKVRINNTIPWKTRGVHEYIWDWNVKINLSNYPGSHQQTSILMPIESQPKSTLNEHDTSAFTK